MPEVKTAAPGVCVSVEDGVTVIRVPMAVNAADGPFELGVDAELELARRKGMDVQVSGHNVRVTPGWERPSQAVGRTDTDLVAVVS